VEQQVWVGHASRTRWFWRLAKTDSVFNRRTVLLKPRFRGKNLLQILADSTLFLPYLLV